MYKCDICFKQFKRKHNYDRHLSKKYPCKGPSVDNAFEEVLSNYDLYGYKCEICNASFSKKYNLERHKENPPSNCLMLIGLNDLKKEMIKSQNRPVVQNNTINHNNIIQFVLPGQETIGHITDTQFLEALDMDDFQEVLCELMRMTYFNPDAPENNHWCVAFLNGKYGVLQYNPKTERIERTSTEKSIVLHFDNLFYSLGEKMDYFMNELTLTDNQIRNINIFYKYLGTSDPNPEEFNEIKMMAYNNRSVPIELWKSMGIDGEHKKIKL